MHRWAPLESGPLAGFSKLEEAAHQDTTNACHADSDAPSVTVYQASCQPKPSFLPQGLTSGKARPKTQKSATTRLFPPYLPYLPAPARTLCHGWSEAVLQQHL